MQFVAEIIGAGHQVVGMTKSDDGAATLKAMGAETHRASLDDPESVARGAVGVDAVIHTALDHDVSRYAENCGKDICVINAIGAALGGERPLIITSGTGTGANRPGGTATEEIVNLDPAFPRSASERAAAEALTLPATEPACPVADASFRHEIAPAVLIFADKRIPRHERCPSVGAVGVSRRHIGALRR